MIISDEETLTLNALRKGQESLIAALLGFLVRLCMLGLVSEFRVLMNLNNCGVHVLCGNSEIVH